MSQANLTTIEETQLLATIQDPRDLALVLLILDCQLKLGEVEALCLPDIKWKNETLKIPKKRGKYSDLSPRVSQALKTYIESRPKTSAKNIFLTQKGDIKPLSSRGIDHIIRTYGEKAGLGSISARTLKTSTQEATEAPSQTNTSISTKHILVTASALLCFGLIKYLLKKKTD
jgi:integrase